MDGKQLVVEQISIPYVIQVPDTKEVDGEPVTKMRFEKRKRLMQVARGKLK